MQFDEKIRREYEKLKKQPDYETLQNLVSLRQKQKHAEKVIGLHVAGSFAIGFTPIPLSDAPILLANQAGLFARILYVYDVDRKLGDTILSLVSQLGIGSISSSCAAMGANYLTAQLLKFIPGFGSAAGGLINGSVAAIITQALGMAVSNLCYYRCKHNDNGASLTNEDIEVFYRAFSKVMEKYTMQNR